MKYDRVPEEHVREFLHYSGVRAQALLEDLDRWLAERDREERSAGGERTVSLGLGIHQILGESPQTPAPRQGDADSSESAS